MPRSPEPPSWVLDRRRLIGRRTRVARERAGLTQQQVGERTGIDRTQVGRIELGKDAPLIDSLILIADAIGVSLAELVREDCGPIAGTVGLNGGPLVPESGSGV